MTTKKTYSFDFHRYPTSVTVQGETEKEALDKALEQIDFSVYETVITDVCE